MHFAKSGLDIITVSETWLTPDIDSCILDMDGYQMLQANRKSKSHTGVFSKKGGGLLTFVKNDLNFVAMHQEQSNTSDPNVEIQRLELKSEVQRNILVYNVYRPPNGSVERGLEIIGHSLELGPASEGPVHIG